MIVEGVEERYQPLHSPDDHGHVYNEGHRLAPPRRYHLVQEFRLEELPQCFKIGHHVNQPKAEESHPRRSEVETLTVKQKTTSTEKF